MITYKQAKKVLKSDAPVEFIKKYLYQEFSKPENFETFCRFVLPKAFTKPFAPFHHEIIKDFMSDDNSALAAPRGHGKSTLIGQGFVLWNILYKKKHYIVYTSQNHSKSVQFLDPVRFEIKNNDRIKFIFGEQQLSAGKDDDGKDREDVFDIGKVRLQALSFEKNIRGLKHGNQRPDLIILDDIEDDERVLNPDLRSKDGYKIDKQIIPSLDAETGIVKMIGTVLHLDSQLIKKIKLFDGRIFRACELDDDGNIIPDSILFPKLFTAEKLQEIKRIIGTSSFQSEYLNDPVDNSSSLIKREWILKCFDHEKSFSDDIGSGGVLGVDFAYSDRVSADNSAYVLISSGEKHLVQMLEIRKGMTITEQFDLIQHFNEEHAISQNALEENSIRSMSNELKKYNFPFTLFWTGNSDKPNTITPDKFFEGKRHTVSKINMIKRLATQFENNNIIIPYKTSDDKEKAHRILAECTSFALSDGKLVEVGVHPDIPIALAYAIEYKNMNSFVMDW